MFENGKFCLDCVIVDVSHDFVQWTLVSVSIG